MLTRREVLKSLGVSAACLLGSRRASAQPGGTSAIRLPLEEFAASTERMAGLRRAVREMKRRKPSDRLSWFFQAAIHGVSPALLSDAAAQDPGVARVFQRRYWNQCPHVGDNSANFLPWHRAYTWHFEKIVRRHAELDDFALPYWNYNDLAKPQNREFPREFGIEHLDGDRTNDAEENINPLFLAERDFFFAGYEHPFTDALPLLALTPRAVDASRALAAPSFFGTIESEGLGGAIADEDPGTRGLLEQSPHDQVHRAVGGIVGAASGDPAVGFMATPPTAAFDPIFPIHHTNIDRLWARWSCLPGKTWGNLPSDDWFNERPWFFIDEDGRTVNRPRRDYFDYRALGIRFFDEDPSCVPLPLPSSFPLATPPQVASIQPLAALERKLGLLPVGKTVADLPAALTDRVKAVIPSLAAAASRGAGERRVLLRLNDVKLGLVAGTGFDVFLVGDAGAELDRDSASFVGSIKLFSHLQGADEHRLPQFQRGQVESFDVTDALLKLQGASIDRLKVIIEPYPLLEAPGQASVVLEREIVTVESLEMVTVDLE